MMRTAIKGVAAHKLRMVMTAVSIMLGVAFIAGTYIFTDTIDRTFSDLFDDAFAGQDVIVQAATEFDAGFGGPPPIDEAALDVVVSVPGVAAAEGQVGGFAQLTDRDGNAIQPAGPPTLGGSWTLDERLRGNIELRSGRGPTRDGEIAIDAATASGYDLAVGDRVDVLLPIGIEAFEIVGVAGFGESDNLAGATFTAFDLATAQRVLKQEGQLTNIVVAADEGVKATALRDRIQLALPEGLEAITAADAAAEQSEALQESLGFIRTALLVFALVAVFVASFIIQNTFRIIVTQRQRELALLRAVGATGRQIVWMVIIEAFLVALVASVAGIVLGFVIAGGLTALMAAVGFDLPSTTAPLTMRTVVVGLTAGVVVTLASALLPAIRASRVPPVAALQDMEVEFRMSNRLRIISGSIMAGLGAGLLLLGLFGDVSLGPINGLVSVGLGALLVFLAVSVVSVLIVKPLAKVISWPMPLIDKLTGTLAAENSVRRPRRTATTSSALMIGLALVTFFFIFGSSIKASAGAAIEEGLRADYVLSVEGFAGGFSPQLAQEIDALPEIEATTSLRIGFWDRDGSDEILIAVQPETISKTIFLGVEQGSLEALVEGGVLVYKETAEGEGWTVGDVIPMGFTATGLQQVEIVGIYSEQNVVQSPFLVSTRFFEQNFSGYGSNLDFVIAVKALEGVEGAAARSAVETAAAEYPNVTVSDQAEYRQSQEDQINTLLVLFNALLFLAVIIALVGITNTLALSVFERTREIGLLRAVGMSRWQVRRMVLWESIIVAVIGALLGIVVGLFFGIVVTLALGDQGIDVLSAPIGQIAALVVVAAFVGLVASIVPARKAARLNVLEAIAHQ